MKSKARAGGSVKGARRSSVSVPRVSASPVMSLSGIWQIATDPKNRGREEKWFEGARPSAARDTRVPSIIQEVFPGYHGVAWYWRTFSVPKHPSADGRYLLRFWAVGYLADVWVNGTSVGGHEGGESPFILDATQVVVPGENQLAVRVLNPTNEPIDGITLKQTPHRNKVDPPSPGSDFNHGGIFLPVELILAPGVRILDSFARPDWETGVVRLQVTARNAGPKKLCGSMRVHISPAAGGETLVRETIDVDLPHGDSVLETTLLVENHRVWSLEDPFLYRVTMTLKMDGAETEDESSIRTGFRDFRVERGYFRLNGKRVFLKSTHTGNCCPVGQIIPPDGMPDILRRDLIYAKACGYNTVRFIAMSAHPWELDMCDELGLMVYQESYACWLLEDSPAMKKRFDSSIREMVLRDRNHPCLVIHGLLNETFDGPVFRHAVETLSLLRSLDDTRLVLLSSGRWDGQWSIGSVSNPGSATWEHAWGREAPGAAAVPAKWDSARAGYLEGAGDAHIYPTTPHPRESVLLIRTVGGGSRPVFLSEYGIGSMMDVIHEARSFEQHGARNDLEDYRMLHDMGERLAEDMERWGMKELYPFPEELLIDSQRRMARHRIHGFDLVRSNPNICGFNLTGMLDHALTGEGMWRLWRTWKPGAMDALQNGWWPVRWCLFVDPSHAWAGRPLRVEAVLANEDVLRPGRYPVCFRVFGPQGIAWERRMEAVIPTPGPGEDPPLAVSVLNDHITLAGPSGTYRLVADMERGGAPLNRSLEFYLSDPGDLPKLAQTVTLYGIDTTTESWLITHGVTCRHIDAPAQSTREVILVGNLSKLTTNRETWVDLAGRIARGGIALFLSCEAFRRAKDVREGEIDVGWLPLAQKGRCHSFNDGLYHKENVARRHPVFDGLQGNGILDWYYYGSLIPRHVFEGLQSPDEVIAASFATGYCGGGSRGYESGLLMSAHRLGSGRLVLSTFPVLENLDGEPAADRMLLNLIRYAASLCTEPLRELPSDFRSTLQAIGYTP